MLSARKSADAVRQYVEWLYALLNYGASEHLALARYNRPFNPYKAKFLKTNTGVLMQSTIMCGHNRYLVTRFARDVELIGSDDGTTLRWTEPDRYHCDPRTRDVDKVIPGEQCQAAVQLPLQGRI